MTSLTPLTDKELAAALHELAAGERANTLEILVHLSEFERRDLHLRLGYPSMFEYCTRGLGYSESSAVRRLQSARLARRFPEVYRAIERKDLTVVTASMLSPVITRDNVNGLIAAARGKLQREVKGIVAALRPATMVIPDRVIPLSVPAPAPEVLSMLAPDAGGSAGPDRQDSYRHNGGKNPSTSGSAAPGPDTAGAGSGPGSPSAGVQSGGPPGGAHPADSPASSHPVGPPPTEKRFKFEFGAGKDFMKKFSRVQSLISNKIPVRMTFEVLFECLMDEYLDRHDPEKRAQRREIRRAKAGTSRPSSTAGASQPGESAGESQPGTIPGDSQPGESAGESQPGTTPGDSQPGKSDSEAQSGTTPGGSQTGSTARAPQPGTTIGDSRPEANPQSARHIPAAVRDSVYTRDSGRCTFTGPNGVRCETTRNLQIDHVKPFALGGGNDPSNLRLLCAKHNQLQAKRTFGVTHTPAHHCRE